MRPVGRLLVLLTTMLLLVMPVTEHLCNWDHFLRGGQDVEFNLLASLLFAAMVVLARNGSRMQSLLRQPVFAATLGSCGQVISPGALVRREFSRQAPSIRWLSEGVDDPAPVSGSGTLMPLRI